MLGILAHVSYPLKITVIVELLFDCLGLGATPPKGRSVTRAKRFRM